MQRGIGSVFILIGLAAIIGISAIAYGYFVISGNIPNRTTKQTVKLPPEHLIPSPLPEVGTTECPDTDYTGCDNSSLWMTWDGQLPETTPPLGSSLLEK